MNGNLCGLPLKGFTAVVPILANQFGCVHSVWQFRFQWQERYWAATGIVPGTGRHSCQTWKQLYALSVRLHHTGFDQYFVTMESPKMAFQTLKKLWDSGEACCSIAIKFSHLA